MATETSHNLRDQKVSKAKHKYDAMKSSNKGIQPVATAHFSCELDYDHDVYIEARSANMNYKDIPSKSMPVMIG